MTHAPAGREVSMEAVPLWASAAAIAVSALLSAQMLPQLEMPLNLFVVAFVVIPLACLLERGRLAEPRAWWMCPLMLVALLVALSLVFTVSPGRSVYRALSLFSAASVFAAVVTSRRDPAPVVCSALALAGLTVSAIGANEYAVHARAGDPAWRIFATFFNPGFLSGFLVLSIPATLALLLAVRERGIVLGLAFAAVLQFAALSLTGARAGVLAGALGVAVFAGALLLGRSLGRALWLRLGLTLVCALIVAAGAGRPTGQRVASPAGEGHSLEFRKYTWAATARMAAARPLVGFGPGAYEVAIPRFTIAGYTRMAHSNYLQAAAESGIPAALIGFLVWAAIALWPVAALARRSLAPASVPFVAASLAALAATSVRGVFDSDWWCLSVLLAVAALTGLLTRDCASGRDASSPTNHRVGLALAVAGVAAAVLGTMSWVSFARQSDAQTAEKAGDWAVALEAWDSAASVAPWNSRARLRALELRTVLEGTPLSKHTLREFNALQDLEPTNPRVPAALADALVRIGNRDQALVFYAQARKLDPRSPRLLLDEARLLESLGRRGEALSRWREMLGVEASPYGRVRAIPEMVDATYSWAHSAVGDDLKTRGDLKGAVREWHSARALLEKWEKSMREMRPLLDAAGLADPEFEQQAASLLASVRSKIRAASPS